jgi:hypothetical protein
VSFKNVESVQLIHEVGQQRQGAGFLCDFLGDDFVERHIGGLMMFEADAGRRRGTPDHLANLRLCRWQQLKPAVAVSKLHQLRRAVSLVPEILSHRGDDPDKSRAHQAGQKSDKTLAFL